MLTRNSVIQGTISFAIHCKIINGDDEPVLPGVHDQLVPRVTPSPRPDSSLTLDSRLGSGGGDGTDGSNHKVSKQRILVQRVLGQVVAEVGDLAAPSLALEGALESRARTITESRGGADCAGAGETRRRSNGRLRKSARSGCERCHRRWLCVQLRGNCKLKRVGFR
jgi:hypothetical protein